MLAKRKFAEYMPNGAIKWLYCKVCGAQIGRYEQDRKGFVRNSMYAEVKIQFDDGSYHVTNGCKNCIKMSLAPDTLQEMYEADCEDAPSCSSGKGRMAVQAVAVSYDQQGLL